jgi:hypothetical protein
MLDVVMELHTQKEINISDKNEHRIKTHQRPAMVSSSWSSRVQRPTADKFSRFQVFAITTLAFLKNAHIYANEATVSYRFINMQTRWGRHSK